MMNLITPDPVSFPILARHYGGLGPPEMRKPSVVETLGSLSQATNPECCGSYINFGFAATMGVRHVGQ